MKIYLGDLAHYTIKLTNNHTPINLGFIAAYLKKHLGDGVELTLFKNPDLLMDAIDRQKPDVLALSNYVWCQSISELVFKYYKRQKPDGMTIWGGPNFPMNEVAKAKSYLAERPYVDFYIPYEGEIPVLNLVKNLIELGGDYERMQRERAEALEGSYFLLPSGELFGRNIGVQMKDINDVPSPYLTGLMDPFLKEGIYPMFETQRGCPYHCAFCHTGLDYYNKGRSFTLDRCKEEILHITSVVPDPSKAHLYITDSNFGMWPQDLEFTKWLHDHYEKTGFPLSFGTSTGKGRIELVLETVKNHPKLMLNNAVQSMDDNVLNEIRRKNLSVAQLSHSQREIDKEGKLSTPEVILGLPMETRESHLNTLRLLINEIGASLMFQYTLMLLPGTQLYTEESRNKYKYNVRFRVLPTSFGEYRGEKCFEIEEVAAGHKDLSYAEYLEMREVFFYMHNINSNAIYRPLVRLIRYLGDDVIDFFLFLMRERRQLPADALPNRIVGDYLKDTQEELFDSREAITSYFNDAKNYEDLKAGRKGKNLTHNYRAMVLLHAKEWQEYVTGGLERFVAQKHGQDPETRRIMHSVIDHIRAQAECQYRYFMERDRIPTRQSPVRAKLDYDVPVFFMNPVTPTQTERLKPQPCEYAYYIREEGIKYIRSFPADQRLVDWALIVLRMDQTYFLPSFERVDAVSSSVQARTASDFTPLKHNP